MAILIDFTLYKNLSITSIFKSCNSVANFSLLSPNDNSRSPNSKLYAYMMFLHKKQVSSAAFVKLPGQYNGDGKEQWKLNTFVHVCIEEGASCFPESVHTSCNISIAEKQ